MSKAKSANELEGLVADLRRGPRPMPVFLGLSALQGASDAELLSLVQGIKAYQQNPFRRTMPEIPVIWEKNNVKMRALENTLKNNNNKLNLIIIPSMINRYTILDLLPQKSLVRWLFQKEFNVFILDWGNPADDEGLSTLESTLEDRLLPALSYLHGSRGHYSAIGYCMGGTLLAGAASFKPEGLDRAVFLASPWDFHAGDRKLQGHVMLGTPSALQMMESGKRLPTNWIQSVFAAVNHDRNIGKFADFAKMDQDSDKARLFVAVEDWLNDGVDLPAGLARSCVVDWYGKNAPAKGEWIHKGQPIDPSVIDVPSLVITSDNDRLVPKESALALAQEIPHAEVLHTSCGHIGMMTGSRAEKEAWTPMAQWLSGIRLAFP